MVFSRNIERNLQQHVWTQRRSYQVKQVRKRKTNSTQYHFYVESKIGHKLTCPQNRNRLTHTENRFVVAKGNRVRGQERDGLEGSIVDANHYI